MDLLNDSSQSIPERKPAGHILVDGVVIADTKRCGHCGGHFISIKGSGKRRGFCMRCMTVTCGAAKCDLCAPWEKKIEEYEQGKRLVLS